MARNPQRAPARYLEQAPAIVRANVLDVFKIQPAAPLSYDVIFRNDTDEALPRAFGLDFGQYGAQGCHWYLSHEDMAAYRRSRRHKRVLWQDLPADTQAAITAYLTETN